MTVSTATSRVDYTGNGVTTAFAVPFPFIEDSYLTVIRTVIATGVETTLVLNSGGADGYTVTGAGQATGTVTVVTAPSVAQRLSIIRAVPGTQEADFVANDPFPAETFEDSLDKLQMQINDNATRASRSPVLFDSDIDGSGRYNSNGNRYADAADAVNAQDLVTLTQLGNATNANAPFVQAGTGAVIRTMQNKARDIVSVKDFGATGNGTTDDTAAIQLAIDYAETIAGTVYFPPGTYKVSDTLTINVNGVHLQGAGMWNTILTRSGDYGDTVIFTGNDATGVLLSDVGMAGFTIKSTGLTTSGAHIHLNGIARCTVKDIYLLQGFVGIRGNGLTAAYISKVYAVFTNLFGGSATGRRFMSFASAAATYAHPSSGDVFITDFNVRGNTANQNTEYGLYVESSDGIWFENGHIGNTSVANIFLNAADAAHHIGLLFFTNVMSDEGAGYGLRFAGTAAAGRNIQFANCNFKGGGNGLDGISSSADATFNNVQFSNCFVTEYELRGMNLVSAGLKNWDFADCQVRGNSYDAALYPGVNIQNVKDFRFTGGKYGGQNVQGDIPGNQTYGLAIGTGVENIMVTGVDLRDNATGDITINGTIVGQVTLSGCRGQASTIVASASTLTLPEIGDTFHISGTTTINNIQVTRHGRAVRLIFDDVCTVTDGGNKRLSAAFTSSADDTLSLVFDPTPGGANWFETGRSVN